MRSGSITDALITHAEKMLSEVRQRAATRCKICGEASRAFDVLDLNKSCDYGLYPLGLSGIPVVYRRCDSCAFIFTEFFDGFSSVEWRQYIYNDQYILVDPDYVSARPISNAALIQALFSGRTQQITGLDYGGGNGRTAELLRSAGMRFDTYDPYGQTSVTSERQGKYDFCSAFEVFEHSPDPQASLQDIVDRVSDDRLMVLLSTSVHDTHVSDGTRLAWWYAAPRNGHISLFSRKAMHIMAEKAGLRYTPIRGMNATHLLTRGVTDTEARRFLIGGKLRLKAAGLLRKLPLRHRT